MRGPPFVGHDRLQYNFDHPLASCFDRFLTISSVIFSNTASTLSAICILSCLVELAKMDFYPITVYLRLLLLIVFVFVLYESQVFYKLSFRSALFDRHNCVHQIVVFLISALV